MKTTNRQKRLTKTFEGLRLKAYADGNGNMTIGYGHRIRTKEKKKTISLEEAKKLFLEDMEEVEKQVTNLNLRKIRLQLLRIFMIGLVQ